MMIMFRNILLLLSLGVAIAPTNVAADDRPAIEQIREYITQATAMRRSDFNQMARMTSSPEPDDFQDKSLTLLLFTYRFPTDEKTEQFQLLSEFPPKPSELARVINRGFGSGALFIPTAPVSLIQQDYITDLTCDVEGDRASGVVSFRVPKVFAGKVNYIAEKTAARWQITELMMSDLDLHLVRGDEGLWKEKE
ncbi:MAG: hypothetical protein HUJ26_14555 [Planctomycetaceae bacterium]|nr:hypothetical protein [Planctomycetaceae bacterium]